jgi:hypothetical protein
MKGIFRSAVLACIAMSGAACVPGLWQKEVVPRDEASARRAVWQAIKHDPPDWGVGPLREDHLELIPTRGTWLEGNWVVGVPNRMRGVVGGPRYLAVYLVGFSLGVGKDSPFGTRYITQDFRAAFKEQVRRRPPATEAEALEIATCYAWLAARTQPERLKILRRAEDVHEGFKAQIRPPRVEIHPIISTWRKGPVFTVEFFAQSKDFWGDIYFWHMEIGREIFSVSRRPVFVPLRAQL